MPKALAAIGARFKGVLIEQRPALAVIDRYDVPDALIYLDPPYVPLSRSQKRRGEKLFHSYSHELTAEDHEQLLDRVLEADAMVVISGYPTPLYTEKLQHWARHEIDTHADGALDRREVLWLNSAAVEARGGLFA